MKCFEADCKGYEKDCDCECYKKVSNINDHMAMSCNCGSVKWVLLRTEKIECAKCGSLLIDTVWHCNNSKYAAVPALANIKQDRG